MRDYEIVYIFRSSLTPEEIEAKLERYHAIITENGQGEITAVVQWGKRQLAYPIQKQPNGHYVIAQFASSPQPLTELERVLKLEDDVLRYLVVISEGEMPLPAESIHPSRGPEGGGAKPSEQKEGVPAEAVDGAADAPDSAEGDAEAADTAEAAGEVAGAAPDDAEAADVAEAADADPEDADTGEAAEDEAAEDDAADPGDGESHENNGAENADAEDADEREE